jgi:cytochrome c
MTFRKAVLATAWILIGVILSACGDKAKSAAVSQGHELFQSHCAVCHAIATNTKEKSGPNLHGVLGRKVGAQPGFPYSEAMRNAGFTWDAASLDRYLQNPQETLPGNKMGFTGIPIADNRTALIAYLQDEGQ